MVITQNRKTMRMMFSKIVTKSYNNVRETDMSHRKLKNEEVEKL